MMKMVNGKHLNHNAFENIVTKAHVAVNFSMFGFR